MGTGWSRYLPMFRSPNGEGELTRETIFEMLKSERRRYALHYLKQREGRVDLGDLAEQVAAWETDTPVEDVETQARQRAYISLLQTHLPTMDQAGVVRFDEEAGTVELSAAADAIDIYLEIVPADDIAWAEYYLGVTLFNGLLLVVVWQDIYPFGILPDAVWGIFVAGLFVLATLIHFRYHRQMRLGTEGPPAN